MRNLVGQVANLPPIGNRRAPRAGHGAAHRLPVQQWFSLNTRPRRLRFVPLLPFYRVLE
jgi:hypothetical protein